MSKSLKNFLTIKEQLAEHCDARTLRLFVLLHQYDTLMNYTEGSMQEAVQKDKKYREFITNVKTQLRQNPIRKVQKLNKKDKALNELFWEKKQLIDGHLKRNFHT